MRFLVKAHRDRDGVTVLAFEAANALDARQQAERQGYTVLSTRGARFTTPHLTLARRFSVPLFCEELLALLDAGLGLVEAIALLAHKARTPDGMRILGELKRVLDEGRSFSTALDSVPGAFPPVLVASVRASEQTGNPPEALRRFLAYHRQISGLRDKILAASVYPAVLLVVGALVVVFLLAYVIPRFSRVYEDVGEANLPVLSRWLMYWGQLVADHTGLLGVGVAGILAGAVWAASRPRLRAAIERRLWRLPSLGEYLRVYQLARFTRTVAMLLKGGIPLTTALDLTDTLLRQPALQEGLAAARGAIREGRSVSDCFAAHGLATDIGVRLLVVGERSGELGEVMERIAAFYDEEIARAVAWFSRLFEPLLMAVIGFVIGGIVILMYLPIFELASSIQ